jgi:hypothetical protein
VGKQRCGSCRYFEDAGIAGSGWCHHPLRQTTSDLILMVRRNELACRDAWARNLWEEGSYIVDERGAPASGAVEPLPISDVASLLDSGETGPEPAEAQDVVLGEARLATDAVPPWRRASLDDAPIDAPPASRATDSRSALLKAREAFRVKRQPDLTGLPFAPDLVIDATERDTPPVFPTPDSRAGAPLPAADRDSQLPDPLAANGSVGDLADLADDDEALLDALEWESERFADMPDFFDDAGYAGELPEPEPENVEPVGPATLSGQQTAAAESPGEDRDDVPAGLPSQPLGQISKPSASPWTMEYRPKPRETWEWGWEPGVAMSVGDSAPLAESTGRNDGDASRERGYGEPAIASVPAPGTRFRGLAGALYGPDEAADAGLGDVLPGSGPWSDASVAKDSIEDFDSGLSAIELLAEWGGANGGAAPAGQAERDDRPIQLVEGRWIAAPVAIAPSLPRICRTCRDYRAGDQGGRGWCANQWAFSHRHLVDADAAAACESALGSWWLPADDLCVDQVDISAHAAPTPNLDRWLPGRHVAERQRKPS